MCGWNRHHTNKMDQAIPFWEGIGMCRGGYQAQTWFCRAFSATRFAIAVRARKVTSGHLEGAW